MHIWAHQYHYHHYYLYTPSAVEGSTNFAPELTQPPKTPVTLTRIQAAIVSNYGI